MNREKYLKKYENGQILVFSTPVEDGTTGNFRLPENLSIVDREFESQNDDDETRKFTLAFVNVDVDTDNFKGRKQILIDETVHGLIESNDNDWHGIEFEVKESRNGREYNRTSTRFQPYNEIAKAKAKTK